MKRKFILSVAILFAIIVLLQDALAQNGMDYAAGQSFHFSRLRRVGFPPQTGSQASNEMALGVYTADIFPKSLLEVNTNTNYLPFMHPNIANRGFVFSTDCPAANVPYWRMFRGGSLKANIYNPLSSPTSFGNDLVLETTNNKSNIIFSANFIPRMVVTDGASGFVGVGNNFYAPASQFHVNDGTLNTYMQITNDFTGATATDGFRFGVLSTGEVLLNQQEYHPMWFNTNNTLRMVIDETGDVTINSLASCSDMLVTADRNGTLKTTDTETLLSQSKTIAQLQTRINELENKLNNLTAKNN